jgi:alpha-tubulin suppressor-like RCC1 family protein
MIISGGFSLTGGASFAIEREPDAPTIGVATANGSTAATVTFTAPTFNGGRTITTYTATSSPGSITGTLSQAGSGTIDVSGLTTGVSYTFTVTATNALGTSSPSSASNSITPAQSIVSNQIATTDLNTYVINTTNGVAYGWGLNNQGAGGEIGSVGDGTSITRSTPAIIGGSFLSIMGISMGGFGIKSDGSLWSWGADGGTGKLGLGGTSSRSSPTQIGSSTNWIRLALSPGDNGTMAAAINSLGQLYAWGYDDYGTFGNGVAGYRRSSPVQIAGSWTMASIGYNNAIGIKSDGTVWSWGNNQWGFIGDGTTISRSSPVQILSGKTITYVGLKGNAGGLALESDGKLWSWGINSPYGSVGDNTNISRSSPVQVAGSWTSVSGGNYFVLAIRSDNTLWSWGYNGYGELGLPIPGGNVFRSSPVQIGSNSNWTKVAAGNGGAMAYNSSNQLFVWGRNAGGSYNFFRVGDGTSINRSSPVQIGTTWG